MIIGDLDQTLVYYLIKKLTDKNLLHQLLGGAKVLIGQRPGHQTKTLLLFWRLGVDRSDGVLKFMSAHDEP